MIIEMTALDKSNCRKPIYYYNSARNAFKDILVKHSKEEEITALLPAYIGLSAKEGSGIFDPVIESGVNYTFYKLDKDLNINTESLKTQLDSVKGKAVVLLVHYFGYPDMHIADVSALCRNYKAIIVEDEAHGLYTDYIDHTCGIYGDYVLYSIHKMLPYENGGAMKVNINKGIKFTPDFENDPFHIFDYDFYEIASKRKKNAKLWDELLLGNSEFKILRPYTDDVTPQTFPIIVNNFDRNKLYFELNEAGFGDVSLYHTMIKPIAEGNFEEAEWFSKHITNLPVHQDIQDGQIKMMYQKMMEIVSTS